MALRKPTVSLTDPWKHVRLGGVQVHIAPEAAILADALPAPALRKTLKAVGAWAGEAGVQAIRVTTSFEPEEPDWREVVVEMWIDAQSVEEASERWDALGAVLDAVIGALPGQDREALDSGLAFQLLWGADAWDD